MRTASRLKVSASSLAQDDLFGPPRVSPEGFRYHPDLLTAEEEADLVPRLADLPFEAFDFHGHLANRRVVGFGLRYNYERRAVVEAPPFRTSSNLSKPGSPPSPAARRRFSCRL